MSNELADEDVELLVAIGRERLSRAGDEEGVTSAATEYNLLALCREEPWRKPTAGGYPVEQVWYHCRRCGFKDDRFYGMFCARCGRRY
jgi:hypothetical protein